VILEALALDLEERGQIDLSECYVDATFVIAKKGGMWCWKDQAGQRYEGHGVFRDGSSSPLVIHAQSATPHEEVTLVEATLARSSFLKEKPQASDRRQGL